ncbi:Alkali-sensitive linkage protein 1-like protein 1 [Pleurostoma richardsiae]|uniref:Alkali-sensitive linkage protein 1-like protein 1 n=1 Tax=Pleurostoma richardsiae TaxID=41990 RepID=A0AA38VVZ6_9PEZI|nr:Alkali-sensitive linkage protein 1-like protein 1 [Pleurostoma richardsiae]
MAPFQQKHSPYWKGLCLLMALTTATLFGPGLAQSTPSSKRGLAFRGDDHDSDNRLLLSENSSITWYYTWSANTSPLIGDSVVFIPLIHGVDDASNQQVMDVINSLPASSTHLLTFNEPDGTTSSGGSSISPEDAARSYLSDIVPLRTTSGRRSRTWNISHPVVTGSEQGLDWLRQFNASCYELDDGGCPADFVAAHWYGDFAGLASWLGTLREFYNPSNDTASQRRFWVTEMALPQAGEEDTLAMMNESLRYLDGLDDVEGYAWFGVFREDEANAWTGNNVALFDDDGGLTELGALYLGGEARGFDVGMTGGAGYSRISVVAMIVCFIVVVALQRV